MELPHHTPLVNNIIITIIICGRISRRRTKTKKNAKESSLVKFKFLTSQVKINLLPTLEA